MFSKPNTGGEIEKELLSNELLGMYIRGQIDGIPYPKLFAAEVLFSHHVLQP
tara:strand:+ start:118 stop:273 length:156 start_codon:yes stop_codon:yes gene_type:complete